MKRSRGSVAALWDDTLSGYPAVEPGTEDFHPTAGSLWFPMNQCWRKPDPNSNPPKFCLQPVYSRAIGLCGDHLSELRKATNP